MVKRDLRGLRFGMLTVIDKSDRRQDRYCLWKCACDCGNVIYVNTKRLNRGTVTNCGCIPKRSRSVENLKGQRFGRLTVLYQVQNKGDRTAWYCKCDCGNYCTATAHDMKDGNTTSCGCFNTPILENLHPIDGTVLEFLKERKKRCDNKSGFRGISKLSDGGFQVKIGFKRKSYYLGKYQSYHDAVNVRLDAEKLVHQGFLNAYHRWKAYAEEQEDGWENEHPLIFDVECRNCKLIVFSNLDELIDAENISK